jgi:hypothetical protein
MAHKQTLKHKRLKTGGDWTWSCQQVRQWRRRQPNRKPPDEAWLAELRRIACANQESANG